MIYGCQKQNEIQINFVYILEISWQIYKLALAITFAAIFTYNCCFKCNKVAHKKVRNSKQQKHKPRIVKQKL